MKIVFSNIFGNCLLVLFSTTTSSLNCCYFKKRKTTDITSYSCASNLQASVSFYRCTPHSHVIRSYVRFYLPGGMFNWWLLYLNEITASPPLEQRQECYNFGTGTVPIRNPEYQHEGSPIHNSLIEIYHNFNQTFHPQVELQTLLKNFMTSKNGFLKFYLTFVGQYRANNFFPTSSDYTEFKQQNACREEGCFFQIPIILNYFTQNIFDVGPTLNIIPDNENNTYLKNYGRSVFILSHIIARNIATIITLITKPGQYQHVFVKDVIPNIINAIRRIFNITNLAFPRVTIPEQYYNDEVPFFEGQDPRTFLEINFDYGVTTDHLYQNQLKVNLAGKTT